jgi:hypothetical protein
VIVKNLLIIYSLLVLYCNGLRGIIIFILRGPLYLWQIECCIPLKNQFVTEFIRGAVLWTIWLERNKLVFTDKKACSVTILEGKNH